MTVLADALMPLLADKPFALYGHSLGAWVAYALTQASLGPALARKACTSAAPGQQLGHYQNQVCSGLLLYRSCSGAVHPSLSTYMPLPIARPC